MVFMPNRTWLVLSACILAGFCAPTFGQGTAKTAPKAAANASSPDTLLKPFTPPPLAELDAKAKWEKQPVLDALELLKAKWAKEKPLATVAEALKLKNTSPAENAKILDALGRLPKDDSEVDWDATLNRHISADIKSSNPIMISLTQEMDIVALMGFAVFSFDWNFSPFAGAEYVKSWESSADRMYDKVVLRDDILWSDGQPITAHDVAFSFQAIMNPKIPVPAVRSGTDKLRWVHAYDDRTLVYFHIEPLATNVWNMLFPVIPRHIYEKSLKEDPTLIDSAYHVKQEESPISGGPYKLVKRQRGQEIVLERRENYYQVNGKQVRAKPYFKTIRFNIIEDRNTALLALKKGDLDEMILMPEDWKTKTIDDAFYALNTKGTGVEWTSFHFLWNLKTPFFSDVRVRQAMSYAYDYDEMQKTLNYGLYERSNGIFHRTSPMYPKPAPAFYTQDLDKAEELLDEAGWEDSDGDGVRDKLVDGKRVKFEFTLLCPTIPDRIKYSTLMKECLGKIGIVCNVKPIEFVALHDRLMKHEIQAAFGGWGTGSDPDTSINIWGSILQPNGERKPEGRNYGLYINPEIDKLYELGRKEFDRKKRAEIYGKVHTILYRDQPYTWLYFRNSFYAFNKNLRGYMFSPRDPWGYQPGLLSVWKPKKP